MSRHTRFITGVTVGLGLSIIFGLGVAIVGCGSTPQTPAESPTSKPTIAAGSTKGGAQLWSENCMRCHNMRAPDSYSDVNWDIAVHHMRLRADLTGEEQRKIVEFLKAAN